MQAAKSASTERTAVTSVRTASAEPPLSAICASMAASWSTLRPASTTATFSSARLNVMAAEPPTRPGDNRRHDPLS